MPDRKLHITTSELSVMKVLWKEQRCTASVIVEQIERHKRWHFRTIKSLLRNLVKRGLVGFEADRRDSRIYHYFPLISEEAYLAQEREHFLELYYDGNIGAMLNGFLKDRQNSPEDLEDMQKLLLQAAERIRSK
ncbi:MULTISPECIES: BlaI/MecI/CopY family transcriptional regulator [unclassified Paenibacillus]|uniref:BlaI/MecI/CopY family transcriptional regulator n=1 Tax=unclassified Paenibacillus TaxID=185978 RepID=UPI001C0FD87D|nr:MULTISPECIES: BlaI/MecI/CopY family transcriptional regulator [unclassified Paenibacillus]MBU5444539.1 BlaI/MecI/CopY family transcriptional regulator [Paenibacillus sp. MSJ-34]CAH0120848.1 Penicillinase repressor [Paenibacillus sp. CECT 9249]